MSKALFNEFEAVSAKAWKQNIQADLKGADYNETLIWKTDEGINVKPFYHSDDFNTLPSVSKSNATQWKICQAIEVNTTKEANANAVDAINRGAESIIFYINSEAIDLKELFQNIDLKQIPIEIKCNFISEKFIKKLNDTSLSIADKQNVNNHLDIIGNLAKTGNWFYNLKEDQRIFKANTAETNQLSIDLGLYQNAGATLVQQLAYGLAHSNEYLNLLDNVISKTNKQEFQVTFNSAIDSNYFFEIAKIRALRQLWETLAFEYEFNSDCKIIATPSKRNKTIYDYNTNLLRTTTECMSAVLGGADSICNLAYDSLYHHPNEFGERIARNQLLVLKNESYFDKVNNPADGTYYIENLTQQLTEKALEVFKDIEANGGFLKQLKEGTIQRKIKESATKEQADFNTNKRILLGTNKHQNTADKMKNNLEKQPFLKIEKRKTLIEPIIEKRLSEQLEIKRLEKE